MMQSLVRLSSKCSAYVFGLCGGIFELGGSSAYSACSTELPLVTTPSHRTSGTLSVSGNRLFYQ